MSKLNSILYTFIFLLFGTTVFGQTKTLEKLHKRISTGQYDEIAPCVSADGLTLYFTRSASPDFERTLIEDDKDLSQTLSNQKYLQYLGRIYSQLAGQPIRNPSKSIFNQDIWMAQTAVEDFDILLHPTAPLNNALPNSISTILPHTNEVILVNQFIENGGMKNGFSKSKRNKDGSWTFPKPININNFHNSGSDVNVTISQNGKVMIMALERSDAYGRSDLYISHKQTNGVWSEPKNLGRGVNTLFREATPHLSADGRQLFFSSDRGNTNGTSNIYMQQRIGDRWDKWTAPQKFRKPINSSASDSHPYFCQTTGRLYFSSNRHGSWDIFRIPIAQAKPNGLLVEGEIFNDATMKKMDALITSKDGNGNLMITNSRNGKFKVLLPWNAKVKITAGKKMFKDDFTVITTGPKVKTSFVKNISLYLEPKEGAVAKRSSPSNIVQNKPSNALPTVGTKLDMDHIYFAQSSALVLKESYAEMDRLGNYLLMHPYLKVLISGHTDNQGEQALLKKLSEDRANSIKQYLVHRRHLSPDRIKTIGYGASKSINDNSSEKLRRINRRVEIEIIEVGTTTEAFVK